MMNYTFMPSLGQMARVVISVSLWNENDVMNSIYFYYLNNGGYFLDETLQQIEDKVAAKILQLPLPENLKVDVRGCIKPIGIQFLKWIRLCSESGIKVERYLMNELGWTSFGTVDVKKTAKCLIKNEDLDICKRYELACVFCLIKDIPVLWKKIPVIRSKGYYSKYVRVFIPNKLALLWAYDMKGELARLSRTIKFKWSGIYNSSPYLFAFEYSVNQGNRAGTELFLSKMAPDERRKYMVRVAERTVYRDQSDIFTFLLSQMDEEQVTQVYQHVPELALTCLLAWPFQKLFMKMARNVWNFLHPHDFEYVLKRIVQKVGDGFKDYDYQALFSNFWEESPAAHKRYVMDRCVYGNLLTDLSRIKDVENTALHMRL